MAAQYVVTLEADAHVAPRVAGVIGREVHHRRRQPPGQVARHRQRVTLEAFTHLQIPRRRRGLRAGAAQQAPAELVQQVGDALGIGPFAGLAEAAQRLVGARQQRFRQQRVGAAQDDARPGPHVGRRRVDQRDDLHLFAGLDQQARGFERHQRTVAVAADAVRTTRLAFEDQRQPRTRHLLDRRRNRLVVQAVRGDGDQRLPRAEQLGQTADVVAALGEVAVEPEQRRALRVLIELDHRDHLPGKVLQARGELARALLDQHRLGNHAPEQLFEFGEHLGGEQRIAAAVEEVVVRADRIGLQQAPPDAQHIALQRRQQRIRSGGARARLGGAHRQQRIAQAVTQHLAGQPARQFVEQLDAPRHLEVHQFATQILAQRLRLHLHARPQHHRGGHVLTETRMRHGERRGLGHRRVAQQCIVDLLQADLLAAAVDHLAQASMQAQKAIGIEAAQIAGVEPAIVKGRLVQRRVAEIAGHQRRSAEQHLAAFAGRDRRARVIDDAHGAR